MLPRRTLVVGDVHGCLGELRELIDAARLQIGQDALVFVGDLVAKGPDTRGVLALARRWSARSVMGNHDAYLLRFRRGEVLREGHQRVAASLEEADWAYLEALPLFLRVPEGLVVHGGVVPGLPLERQEEGALLGMRSIDPAGRWSSRVAAGAPWASAWPGPEPIFFGHDAVRGLQQWPYATGLDTGCAYGGALTGLLLPERRLLSVRAHRQWCVPDGGA